MHTHTHTHKRTYTFDIDDFDLKHCTVESEDQLYKLTVNTASRNAVFIQE